MRRAFWAVPLAVIAAFGLIQAVPYGRNHNNPHNPPVVAEPNWDSTQTRELAVRACYDCHSNETVWLAESVNEGMPPWYYVIRHPAAKLTSAEKQALADGL